MPRPVEHVARRHAWALNSRSEAVAGSVDAGAVTQFWVKKLSPISNSRRSSLRQRRRRRTLNALRAASTSRVVSPPSVGDGCDRRRPRSQPRTTTTPTSDETNGWRPSCRRRRDGRGRRHGEHLSSGHVDGEADGLRGGHDGRRLGLERLDAVEMLARPGSLSGHALDAGAGRTVRGSPRRRRRWPRPVRRAASASSWSARRRSPRARSCPVTPPGYVALRAPSEMPWRWRSRSLVVLSEKHECSSSWDRSL